MNIRQVVKEANEINKEISQLTNKLAAYKIKIQQYFDKKNEKKISVEVIDTSSIKGKSLIVTATKVERVYINYFVDKLKERFSKEIYSKIIEKKYTIENMDGLVKLLKEYEVPPKKFKQYISVEEKPNNAMIKQLYAIGEIEKGSLKGCFEANITKSISLKEAKKGEKDE